MRSSGELRKRVGEVVFRGILKKIICPDASLGVCLAKIVREQLFAKLSLPAARRSGLINLR